MLSPCDHIDPSYCATKLVTPEISVTSMQSPTASVPEYGISKYALYDGALIIPPIFLTHPLRSLRKWNSWNKAAPAKVLTF